MPQSKSQPTGSYSYRIITWLLNGTRRKITIYVPEHESCHTRGCKECVDSAVKTKDSIRSSGIEVTLTGLMETCATMVDGTKWRDKYFKNGIIYFERRLYDINVILNALSILGYLCSEDDEQVCKFSKQVDLPEEISYQTGDDITESPDIYEEHKEKIRAQARLFLREWPRCTINYEPVSIYPKPIKLDSDYMVRGFAVCKKCSQ